METATYTTSTGTKQWAKGLVERRLDVIRIAEGSLDAYTKNAIEPKNWNQNAREILKSYGLGDTTIDKYAIQKVREY